jgi:membrane protein insertase Oxa1/YidC/SpoIIIJ
MLKLPAGLTLYILVNNLLSIAQQQWIMRKDRKANPAPA